MIEDPHPVTGPRTIAGRYRCTELLGSGGMADVYRATDELLGRDVAVKVLRATSTDDVARARFAAEARTLAGLHHPNLVLVLDAGTEGEAPYLVMELVDGPTLGAQVRAAGPMSADQVADVGSQVADGLAAAHAHGVVHRDVKPGNILLRPGGQAVLADFGIARLLGSHAEYTNAGEVIGSPAYLAPEQVSGQEVSSAADVYSLGLVLLEAATGQRTYPGTPIEAALARLSAPPAIPVSLGGDLVTLLTAMTALEPAVRPTAVEVAASLRQRTLATGTQVLEVPFSATGTQAVVTGGTPRRRPKALLVAACGVAALLLTGLALTTQLGSDEVSADPAPVPTSSSAPTPTSTASADPSPSPSRSSLAPVLARKPAASPSPKQPKAQHDEKKGRGKVKGKGRR